MADVVLEFEAGFGKRYRFWLEAGQVLRVGSSEWADYCIASDSAMSAVHFLVEHAGNSVRVQDLQSRTGTCLNGEQATEFHLVDGDVLRAGQTEFTARIAAHLSENATLREQTVPAKPPIEAIEYRQATQSNGLVRFESYDGAADGQAAANNMRGSLQVAAMLSLGAVSRLSAANFDWHEHVIVLNEQVGVLPLSSSEDLAVLQDLWGRDALTVVATDMDLDSLKLQLLENVTMFGRPRVVRAQLSNGPARYVDTLMTGLKAIMVETENGADWQIYLHTDRAEPWTEIGFPPPVAAQAV